MPFRRAAAKHSRRPRGTKVPHACGHAHLHKIPACRRAREVERLAKMLCPACWAKSNAEALEAALAKEFQGAPALKGTPKQILWARSIRAKALLPLQGEARSLDADRQEAGLPPLWSEILALVLRAAAQYAHAKFWICHREDDLDALVFRDASAALRAARSELEAKSTPSAPAPVNAWIFTPPDPEVPF